MILTLIVKLLKHAQERETERKRKTERQRERDEEICYPLACLKRFC